jgi:hypothetical protein
MYLCSIEKQQQKIKKRFNVDPGYKENKNLDRATSIMG